MPELCAHRPYADSIAVWYRVGSFHTTPDPLAETVVKWHISEAQSEASFSRIIDVAPLVSENDSFYFFIPNIFWKSPSEGERVIFAPMTPEHGDSVLMIEPNTKAEQLKAQLPMTPGISIYANQRKVNVQLTICTPGSIEVQLFSVSGQLVSSWRTTLHAASKITVPMRGGKEMAAGIYFVQYRTPDLSGTKRIVTKR